MCSKIPLLEALNNMADTLPMHMPGHKRNPLWGSASSCFADKKLYELDFTEVPGLDDLHSPRGVIAQAQKLAADCFQSKCTFFLINGASVGVTAAIMSCTSEGDTVLVPRNAHRCVFEGLVLSGGSPVYYQPNYNYELAIPMGADREQVRSLISHYHPKAAIFINPTYHGTSCDLTLIGEARKNNVLTIVDEAHGPHFSFDLRLPKSALRAGADFVIHSTHKTLGSLTQTGLLHLGTDKPDPKHVGNVLSLLQSTSPSYILMASLDAMRAEMAAQGRIIVGRTVDLALELRAGIEEIQGFFCADLGSSGGYDPTKILLQSSLMNGFQLSETLCRDYGVYVEMEDALFVLLMITVGDTLESIKRLIAALKDISFKGYKGNSFDTTPIYNVLPEVVLTPRQAFFAPKKKCKLSHSIGKISGSLLAAYPPGVPLLCPGERISGEIVEYLYLIKANNVHVQGLYCNEDLEILILEC